MKKNPGILVNLTFLLVVAALFTGLKPAFAEDTSGSIFIDRGDVSAFPTVSVSFSAWDANGLPLANLSPQDITLSENGGPGFHPLSVAADTRSPLQVALVIDVSSSMQGQPLSDAKSAAARFIDRLAPGDQVALVAFSDSVDPAVDNLNPKRELGFSQDLAPVYDHIEALQSGGATELYNATAKALRMTTALPAGHRAVLLLSDGVNDPAARGDPEEPIRLAKEAHVPVFVIGLGNQVDEAYLRRLAHETGGMFRSAPTSSELARLFSDMATLLKTRYTLVFPSSQAANGQTIVLKVSLDAQGVVTTSEAQLGPLPKAAAPSSTPASSATPIPTATPAPSATLLLPTQTPAPVPDQGLTLGGLARMWVHGWVGILSLGVLVVVILVVLFLLLRKRKPAPKPEACARCGYDLTGVSGPCPQCGETRRLPRAQGK
jgi:VWFA-related protein